MFEAASKFVLKSDSSEYERDLDKAAKKTRDLDKSQRDLGKAAEESGGGFDKFTQALNQGREKLNLYSKLVVGAGAAMTVALVKSGLESADALAKTSDKLGIATEELAGLRHAAELTGVSSEKMDQALEKLNVRMAEAAAGTGTAVKSFDALGISAAEIINKSPDEALGIIADKMSGVENQTQKAKLAYDIFGRSGVDLVNTLSQGSDALEVMKQEAVDAGVALNRLDARKIEMANDSMFKVRQQVTGFSQQLAVQFAPLLEGVAERLFGVGKEAGGMAGAAGKAFDFMVKAAGVFANGIHVINIAWNGMKLAFQGAAKLIVEGLDWLGRSAFEMWNNLPWTDEVQYSSMFDGFLATMESEIAASQQRIDELLMRELPSDSIEQYVDDTTRAFEAQAIAIQDSQGNVAAAVITTDQVTEALGNTAKASADKAIEAADVHVQAAEKTESAWDKALQGMVERIDEQFSGAWRDALDGNLDSFKDFGRALLDSAKQLFAELLHLNITRPLVQGVAGAFGLGGATSAAAGGPVGAGSLGSLFSSGGSLFSGGLTTGLSNFATSGFNGLSGVYQGVGNLAGDLGFSGLADRAFAAGDQYLNASNWTNLGNLGLNVGAGFLGNWAGGQIFGDSRYGGVGGTIGGAVGSVFGPLGTLAGSFIGNGLGSLIGGRERADRTQLDIDFATGAVNRGRSRGHDLDDAANAASDAFIRFAQTVGGSDARFSVRAHGEYGYGFVGEGKSQFGQDIDAFLGEGFDRIVAGADHLSDALKKLLTGFDGTAEEIQAFAGAMINLHDTASVNSVTKAIEDFNTQQLTAAQSYQGQIDNLRVLIGNFDGSAAAAAELSAALARNQANAYEFAMAIQQLGQSIQDAARQQADSIRQSVMPEEERVTESLKDEIARLRRELPQLTDPEEIQRTTARILELNQQRFDAMSPERQAAAAENIARFAENTADAAQRAIDRALRIMEREQRDVNREINDAMRNAADKQQQAADDMNSAATTMVDAVNTFITGLNIQGLPGFAARVEVV